MRRGWIVFLLAAVAGAQEFSEADLDRAIREVQRGEQGDLEWVRRIAKWGPRAVRAAPALVAALATAPPEFRPLLQEALRSLGPSAIPELAKGLKSKHPWVRCGVASLLEELSRDVKLLPVPAADLFPYVRDKDPIVRESIWRLLARRGAEGEKPFFDLIDDKDPETRRLAAEALASQGAAVVPRLTPLLSDKSPRRRSAVAHALGVVDPPPEEVAGALLSAASDVDEWVRAEAVFAVGRLCSMQKETLALLFRATEDPSPRVVQVAVSALEARGTDTVPALLEGWDRSDGAALAATEALVRLGDPALDEVVEAAKSGSARRRRFGAVYLGRVGAERDLTLVERALTPFLADPASEVRLAAAEAFGLARPEIAGRALEALLLAIADRDPRVRANALAAAARGGGDDPRVRAAIDKAAADAEPEVTLTAALLRTDVAAATTWSGALDNAALPVVVRILAAERLRVMPAGFGPVLPALARVVQDAAQPTDVRASAACTIRLLMWRRIFEGRLSKKGDPEARASADRGLRWLAGAQRKDGSWATEAPTNYDVGLTGLALLAFLAAGHTDRELEGGEPYAANVREGLKFIQSTQQKDGLLSQRPTRQHTMVEHAIATQALCEAVAMTGDRNRRAVAEKALAYCERARNPTLAWRYTPRGGENDTHVTAWMMGTLRVADAAGLVVDADAFEGVRQWIDKMTDPNFGQVGYNVPGGSPFRAAGKNEDFPPDKSGSMTAAGIWCRVLLGEDATTSEMVRKGADCCMLLRPSFAPGSADFYYWYYGTLACFEVGGVRGTKWETDLKKAILPRQRPDGSWDPEDAWGFAGGRVYSTAILTLALLTPTRYPRGWAATRLPANYAEAKAALDAAAASGPLRVRTAALGAPPK